MGAVDDWLREHTVLHTVLHTTTRANDPNANSLVALWKARYSMSLASSKHPWPDAAEHANEVCHPSKRPMPGQGDVVEPIVLERRALSGQAERDLMLREKPSSWPPWGCLAFAIKLEHPTVRRGSLDPIALQGIFVDWNRRVSHGIKIGNFRDDGEIEEVFKNTTVRTRDTMFPLFGDAGTKSATEAKLQKFGVSVRGRPDEGPTLELRRRVAEASADAAGTRPTMMGGAEHTRSRLLFVHPPDDTF